MGLFYRLVIRTALKFQDSEKAHYRALRFLRIFSANPFTRFFLRTMYKPRRIVHINRFGFDFSNPFGLAAGMDKGAVALQGWSSLGLGFTEIGGITQHEQLGNQKPRMFRIDGQDLLINRMGFNNHGSDSMAQFLSSKKSKRAHHSQPLWANIGKSKITPIEDAKNDYCATIKALWSNVDAFVINVSSPNTPQLRELQHGEYLIDILQQCEQTNIELSKQNKKDRKPLLVKVAPDLTNEEFDVILETIQQSSVDGIVICNTTLKRPKSRSLKEENILNEQGGLSGPFLHPRSIEMISHAYKQTSGAVPIVGVGGISSAEQAIASIRAGASLLQAYSGFVFKGPGLIKEVVHGIYRELQKEGLDSLEDLIGKDHGF